MGMKILVSQSILILAVLRLCTACYCNSVVFFSWCHYCCIIVCFELGFLNLLLCCLHAAHPDSQAI